MLKKFDFRDIKEKLPSNQIMIFGGNLSKFLSCKIVLLGSLYTKNGFDNQ